MSKQSCPFPNNGEDNSGRPTNRHRHPSTEQDEESSASRRRNVDDRRASGSLLFTAELLLALPPHAVDTPRRAEGRSERQRAESLLILLNVLDEAIQLSAIQDDDADNESHPNIASGSWRGPRNGDIQ